MTPLKTPLTGGRLRLAIGSSGLLASLCGLAVLGFPATADAQLVAPYNGRITVDSQYVTGATGATDIAWAADGRAVVTCKSGNIIIRQTNGTSVPRNGVFSGVSMTAEQGLLGVVSDPMARDTFYFYVSNGSSADDRHRVFKATLGADNMFTVDQTPVIAASRNLGPGLAGPANHNGGGLWIHQNHLYVGVGDTGANATPPTNKFSSCLNRPNGKILRVALDGAIPTDNPLMSVNEVTSCTSTTGAWGTAMPDRRIYAWGFRNPWRFWIDPMSGLLWVGDVGETTREEISVGTGNSHFGYPFFEGFQDWSMSNGMLRLQKDCDTDFLPSKACTPAVHDYQRSSGTSVTGGLIPDGCGWSTALGGTMYLFADYGSDWIHGLTVSNRMMGTASMTSTNLGTFSNSGPVSMRMGPDESMYVVMNQGNSVYRFTPMDRTGCMGGTGGMGGMGGMAGMSGAGGRGGAGAGGASAGSAGAGMMGGSAGVGGTAGTGGGVDMGGQAGSSAGGATAGTGVTGGASGTGVTGGVSGTGVTGGVGPNGGIGGTPGGGMGATGAVPDGSAGDSVDDAGGCGCRTAKGGGAGYLVFAVGLILAFAARFGRGRRRGQ